ncbi:MAG: response regulator [Planctomycetota bacterium]|jgi:PAS domain S-box-containing protein
MDIKRTKVLLVEDDPAVCRLIGRILSRPGQNFRYRLETASTVSNAIDQLRKKRFDNVLLDLGLPDSKGLGLATVDKIHASNPDVPIIVLTATTDKEIQVEAIKRGADDYLIKGKALWESLGGHIRYVIQHKKAIEALRHSRDYFRSIVQDAPVAVVCINVQGRIGEFNTCAQDLWGQGVENVLGKSFLNTCIGHGERFNVYIDLRKALSGESVKNTKTTIMHTDGRRGSLLWDFNPIRNGAKKISGVIAIARESTGAMVKTGDCPATVNLALNPDFDDTVEMVMNSLTEILEKIEEINSRADPDALKRLARELCRLKNTRGPISPGKNAAIKRMMLSLIAAGPDKTSE